MAKSKKTKAVTLEEKPVNGTSLVKAIDNIAEYSDFNDKGIIGKCDGVFPLTTATANSIYFLPSNGKYYKCKTNYNGNQLTIPNDNFIDMSVLQNSDRLDNLYSFKLLKEGDFKDLQEITDIDVYDFSKFYTKEHGFPILEIVVFLTLPSGGWWGTRCIKFATWSRPNEEITTIYNHNNGSHCPSEVKLNYKTKILSIKPYDKNLVYRVYVCELPIR